jgi:hypothetical protein
VKNSRRKRTDGVTADAQKRGDVMPFFMINADESDENYVNFNF